MRRVVRRLAAVEREQRQAQMAQFREYAIEGWLILEGAVQSGRAVWLVRDLQSIQPFPP